MASHPQGHFEGLGGHLVRARLLVAPAVVGSALCLPVLRAPEKTAATGPGAAAAKRTDGRMSFVRLSLAAACRSIAFVGLSTFISFYARQRTGGGTAAGTAALFLLHLGGAAETVLGSRPADRRDRTTVVRMSHLLTVGAVARAVFVPGPAIHLFIALASVGLYAPFSPQVTLAQDYSPSRVGTAGGITLGPTVSVGGPAGPLIGSVADATSLQTALTALILMPALNRLLYRGLPEPAGAGPSRRPGTGRGRPRHGALGPGPGDPFG